MSAKRKPGERGRRERRSVATDVVRVQRELVAIRPARSRRRAVRAVGYHLAGSRPFHPPAADLALRELARWAGIHQSEKMGLFGLKSVLLSKGHVR